MSTIMKYIEAEETRLAKRTQTNNNEWAKLQEIRKIMADGDGRRKVAVMRMFPPLSKKTPRTKDTIVKIISGSPIPMSAKRIYETAGALGVPLMMPSIHSILSRLNRDGVVSLANHQYEMVSLLKNVDIPSL